LSNLNTVNKMEQTIYKPHSGNDFLADVMLSCPFCGGEPQLTFIGNDYSKKRKVEIKCKGCRVTMVNAGIRSGSEQLAKWSIEAWNKRVGGHGA
jgi:Lar family restriction alleviation protein